MVYFKSLYLNNLFTMIKCTKGGLYTLKFMFLSWPNNFVKVIEKLLLLLLSPIYLALILIIFIITLLGFVINGIPIVSTLVVVAFILIWYVCVFFAMIINLYDSDNYVAGLHKYTDR